MAKNVLDRLVTLPKLRDVWRGFWRDASKKQSSGVDGVTAAAFNANLEHNLQSLQSQLLHGYRFDRLVAHPVPKPDGKKDRIICVPTIRDRLVQRLIGKHLSAHGKRYGIENDASYGFIASTPEKRRGVGAARDRAIKLRCAHQWAYKSDITAFFDRIPREFLLEIVKRTIRTPSLYPILEGAINCEIDTRSPSIRRRVERAGIKVGLGVRQGMPLSPFFANLVLKNFDRIILSKNVALIRYADDFIAFADNEEQCKKINSLARDILGEMGFEIPEIGDAKGKTRICSPDESIDFLGLAISPLPNRKYDLRITKQQLGKISEDLFRFKDLDHVRQENLNVMDLSGVLERKIGGYRSAYPNSIIANANELASILDRAMTEVFINVFTKIFGHEAVSQLTRTQRDFLCLR